MEQVLPHDAFYTHQKQEAEDTMAHIMDWMPPKSQCDVRDYIAEALGIPPEVADVLVNAILWLHADAELKEHNK
jgi:hypothetical protein